MRQKYWAHAASAHLVTTLLWVGVPVWAQIGGGSATATGTTMETNPTGASNQAAAEASVTDNRTGVVSPFGSSSAAGLGTTQGHREGDAATSRAGDTPIGMIAGIESRHRGLNPAAFGLLGLAGLAGLLGLRRRKVISTRSAPAEASRSRAPNP